jgi:flavin-dependent dehydrogenase
MDRKKFPRDKVCAGWVTPAVIQELEIDLDSYSASRVLQPINGFRISQIGDSQVESIYDGKPVSYGIRRFEFDHYLLQRSGADIIAGQAFKTLQKSASGWLVNGQIDARLVVGAGGHACPVARATGARPAEEKQVVLAQEIEFEMTPEQLAACTIEPRVPELFFAPDLAGYGWVFRKGNYLNVGLGREDKHRLPEHVESFCRYLKKLGKIPETMSEKWHGHAYILYPHAKRDLVKENIILIGDAAGLAYPQSGEGIRPAVESALIAADVIRRCKGNYTPQNMHDYHQRLTQRFGQRQSQSGLTGLIPAGAKQLLAGVLMKSPWFNRNVIIDRWFLQSQKPPLQPRSVE